MRRVARRSAWTSASPNCGARPCCAGPCQAHGAMPTISEALLARTVTLRGSMLPDRWCELGDPGPLRDRLVKAVLDGDKTATSSLLGQWRSAGEQLPRVGERQLVVDSAERPVAAIEIVDVEIIRLGDADDDLAISEGEGFRSVSDWREAHEAFWTIAKGRPSQAGARWRLGDDTEVVVERFRVVRRLSG